MVERAAQVRHGEAAVDGQALDLVEDRGVRRVELVGPVDPAGRDDVDRRRARQHGAGLHRAGVRAQHQAGVLGRDEEGVHHRAGRVVAADVERVEVQPLRLELGAVGDLVAHAHEDVGDPVGQRRERVPGAARDAVPGQRDVDPLLGQHAGVALGLELGQPGVVRLLDGEPGGVDPLAGVAPGGRGQRARARGGPAAPARGRPGGPAGRRPAPRGRRPPRTPSARRSPRRRGPRARARRPAWGRRDRWRQTREAILPARGSLRVRV